jgi:glutathione S-transferase
MKLYSSDISPYASRVRIQVHHKRLPVEIAPPPGGMRSAQVLSMNPAGRIPVLDLGDAQFGESWAIMEFLESRFPEPPMLPADPVALARQRELVRFADLYLATSMFPMFLALRGTAGKDEVDKALLNLAAQLKVLEQFLARKPAGDLDLADAALVPIVWYARCMAAHFGPPDCLAGLPKAQAWWARVNAVPAVAKVTGEIDAGLRQAVPVLFKN